MTEYENLAQQLQAARLAAGKTQNEAAQILGCTAQAYPLGTGVHAHRLSLAVPAFGQLRGGFIRFSGKMRGRRRRAGAGPDHGAGHTAGEDLERLGPGDREKLRRIAGILGGGGGVGAAPAGPGPDAG